MSQWEGVMQKHAKSFYLASLFFPKKLFPKVKALYALCRWLDDAVDEAPNDDIAIKQLNQIASDLRNENPQMPVNKYYRQNNLSIGYMEDLIEGAKDDLKTVRISDENELLQYCYKVAGTVGLAMFDLMNVTPKQARANAVDLGIAMQITNICRDIKEDLMRDRIYIPESLLNEQGLTGADLLTGRYQEQQIINITLKLLALADVYYASARVAFKNIPWRVRGPIIIASNLYQGIGLKLRAKGGNPMLGRTYLNKLEKIKVVSFSLIKWLASSFSTSRLNHNPQLHSSLKQWKQLRSFQ